MFRSNAHTSMSSSVARSAAKSEPTAPQPTMQTPHEGVSPSDVPRDPRPTRGIENSRPPLIRRDGARAPAPSGTPTTMMRGPAGRSTAVRPGVRRPQRRRGGVQCADRERSDNRTQRLPAPPMTSIASMMKVSSGTRPLSTLAGSGRRAHPRGLPLHPRARKPRAAGAPRDPDRASRGRVLAGRSQLPPEPAPLVRKSDHDGHHRSDRGLRQICRLGYGREGVGARPDAVPSSGGRCG